MIAIETRYHCKCLAAYYNKVTNEQPTSGKQRENENICGNVKYLCYKKAIY